MRGRFPADAQAISQHNPVSEQPANIEPLVDASTSALTKVEYWVGSEESFHYRVVVHP
jgi:hypothetical protein